MNICHDLFIYLNPTSIAPFLEICRKNQKVTWWRVIDQFQSVVLPWSYGHIYSDKNHVHESTIFVNFIRPSADQALVSCGASETSPWRIHQNEYLYLRLGLSVDVWLKIHLQLENVRSRVTIGSYSSWTLKTMRWCASNWIVLTYLSEIVWHGLSSESV